MTRRREWYLGSAALAVILGSGVSVGLHHGVGSGPTGSAGPGQSPQATASPPPPNYRYLDPALFPEQDTPIAQASAQLKQVWTPYDVTVIPSRHVLDTMPDPPKILNKTKGQLSDSDAQALAWAEYRENAFVGWLESHVQPGLNDHLRDHGLFNGPIGNAVRPGQAVNDPPCDLYARKMVVVPVDDAVRNFEAGKGYSVAARFAIVDLYSGGCTVTTIPAARPLFADQTDTIAVETGAIRHDDVLGDVFFAESGRDCATVTEIPACGTLR